MPKYRIFGITVEIDLQITYNLFQAMTDDPIDLRVVQFPKSWPKYDLVKENLVYQSPYNTEKGDSLLSIYHFAQCYILNYTNLVRFYMFPKCIYYEPLLNFSPIQAETYLLSGVFAIWLELQGRVCLHGSAIVVNQSGLLFLSESGGGKTTLAMSLLQAGYSLLADDIIPIRQVGGMFSGQPAFPTMRTWPAQASYFIAASEELDRVVPGSEKRLLPIGTGLFGQFSYNPVPVRRIYVLERQNKGTAPTVKILPVPPALALKELIKQSFAARAVEGLGLARERLGILANIARNIRMYRLIYSNGFDRLDEVRQEVLGDFFLTENTQS